MGEMSTCLLFQGRFEEAADTARQLLDLAPDYLRGLQRIAVVLSKSGAIDEATEVLNRVTELQPDFSETYVRDTYPYAKTEHLQTLLEGFRLAGMKN